MNISINSNKSSSDNTSNRGVKQTSKRNLQNRKKEVKFEKKQKSINKALKHKRNESNALSDNFDESIDVLIANRQSTGGQKNRIVSHELLDNENDSNQIAVQIQNDQFMLTNDLPDSKLKYKKDYAIAAKNMEQPTDYIPDRVTNNATPQGAQRSRQSQQGLGSTRRTLTD